VAIFILLLRRHPRVAGGELGGPKATKVASSAFFFILWIVFVAFSSMEAYNIIEPDF
jgi:solute carrier family 8 (sodium/calcium exchanger)